MCPTEQGRKMTYLKYNGYILQISKEKSVGFLKKPPPLIRNFILCADFSYKIILKNVWTQMSIQ